MAVSPKSWPPWRLAARPPHTAHPEFPCPSVLSACTASDGGTGREFLPFRCTLSFYLCSEPALPAHPSVKPLSLWLSGPLPFLYSPLPSLILALLLSHSLLLPTSLIDGERSEAAKLRMGRVLGTSRGDLT